MMSENANVGRNMYEEARQALFRARDEDPEVDVQISDAMLERFLTAAWEHQFGRERDDMRRAINAIIEDEIARRRLED